MCCRVCSIHTLTATLPHLPTAQVEAEDDLKQAESKVAAAVQKLEAAGEEVPAPEKAAAAAPAPITTRGGRVARRKRTYVEISDSDEDSAGDDEESDESDEDDEAEESDSDYEDSDDDGSGALRAAAVGGLPVS